MESGDSKETPETLKGTRTGEETDANEWLESFRESIVGKTEAVIPVDRDSHNYNMSHPKRGKAVIFNHLVSDSCLKTNPFKNFTNGQKPRNGTEADEERLKDCFRSLQFEVAVHRDLKKTKLFTVLNELREEDHSQRDCLVVVVLSHGEQDKIFCSDSDYKPEALWNPFTADKCPTLAGKPKLFFIQACRGTDTDSGTKLTRTQTDSRSHKSSDDKIPYVIPNRADFLIVFSTPPNYCSYRSSEDGSWFIQTFTTVVSDYKKKKDLLSMMTIVTREVALHFESYAPTYPDFHEKKQVPMISSTLTREIWL